MTVTEVKSFLVGPPFYLPREQIGSVTLYELRNCYLCPRDPETGYPKPRPSAEEVTEIEQCMEIWWKRGLPKWRVDQIVGTLPKVVRLGHGEEG